MPCDTFCISFRMRRETWKPLAPLIRWLLVEQARCLRLQSMLLHRIFLLVFARICRPCFPGQKRKRRSDSEPIDAILVFVDCSVMMFHVEHPVGKESNVSRETMRADWAQNKRPQIPRMDTAVFKSSGFRQKLNVWTKCNFASLGRTDIAYQSVE